MNLSPRMTMLQHLAEARKRIIYSLLFILTGALVAFSISGVIFSLLQHPFLETFGSNYLIGTGPAEAFVIRLIVSIWCGVILVSPFIFYQLWLYVSPGLHQCEKKWIIPFLTFATLLFLFGIIFCFYTILPLALSFFKEEYTQLGLTPQIRITEYLSLSLKLMLAFGIVFELPLISLLLARAGVLNYNQMVNSTRVAIVVIFVVAAIFTPPDVVSQLLMAIPMVLLYGISIIVVRFFGRE